jgi:hypothetical protein
VAFVAESDIASLQTAGAPGLHFLLDHEASGGRSASYYCSILLEGLRFMLAGRRTFHGMFDNGGGLKSITFACFCSLLVAANVRR